MAIIKTKKANEEPVRTGILGNAIDYTHYDMTQNERAEGFLIGFVGVLVVVLVFFQSLTAGIILGLIGGFIAIRVYRKYLMAKRHRELTLQFKDMLESLTNSYAAGKNTNDAFTDAYHDLQNIYTEDDYIVREMRTILEGVQNGINIEVLLMDFARRSGSDDIESFADVFEVCLRQGANIQNIIASTRDVICDKIEAEQDIRTVLSGNQNELNLMLVMPLIICLMLNLGGGGMSIAANTPVNVAVKIAVLALFAFSYFLGRKFTDIKL